MKYLISVLLGAMSYSILSTIVVKAYGEGYVIGEVVGSQLLTGFLLFGGWRSLSISAAIILLFQFTWMGVPHMQSVSANGRVPLCFYP